MFNSRLTELRDGIVRAMEANETMRLIDTVKNFGDATERKMLDLARADLSADESSQVKRVVDKMLFNYRNIGTSSHRTINAHIYAEWT